MCTLTDGKRSINIFTIYRMPQLVREGIYNTLIQYNWMEDKVKNANKYRKKVFSQIINYYKTNSIDDIIIAGNINQDIGLTEV